MITPAAKVQSCQLCLQLVMSQVVQEYPLMESAGGGGEGDWRFCIQNKIKINIIK